MENHKSEILYFVPVNSPSTMMDSVVDGARETASSFKRLKRRASVSSISPGRDLREDNHRSRVAYMLKLTRLNPTSGSLAKLKSKHARIQDHSGVCSDGKITNKKNQTRREQPKQLHFFSDLFFQSASLYLCLSVSLPSSLLQCLPLSLHTFLSDAAATVLLRTV